MKYFLLYLLLINAAAFLLLLVDKIKAKKNKWRIPERTLFGAALLGGCCGTTPDHIAALARILG